MHKCPGYGEEDCPCQAQEPDTRDRCPTCQRLNRKWERQRRAGIIPTRMQKIEYHIQPQDYFEAMKREEWKC